MIKEDASTSVHRNISTKSERNAEIVRLYSSGQKPSVIGKLFSLTNERVRQILRKAEVKLQRRGNPVRSDRTIFLGVEVTDEVKEALRVEAKRRGLSMSSLTSTTLQEMLDAVKPRVSE